MKSIFALATIALIISVVSNIKVPAGTEQSISDTKMRIIEAQQFQASIIDADGKIRTVVADVKELQNNKS